MKIYSRFSLIKRMLESRVKAGKPKPRVQLREDYMMTYEEKSSEYTKPVSKSDRVNNNAHELFNMFTADIIKEETVFIR